jgi:hypothetical protein
MTPETKLLMARKSCALTPHVVVLPDWNLTKWNGTIDGGGWEVHALIEEVKQWCEQTLTSRYCFRQILYAQGRRMGSDHFLPLVEFDDPNDAVMFKLRWS